MSIFSGILVFCFDALQNGEISRLVWQLWKLHGIGFRFKTLWAKPLILPRQRTYTRIFTKRMRVVWGTVSPFTGPSSQWLLNPQTHALSCIWSLSDVPVLCRCVTRHPLTKRTKITYACKLMTHLCLGPVTTCFWMPYSGPLDWNPGPILRNKGMNPEMAFI